MGLLYENVIRPILFTQDPERVHDLAVWGMSQLAKMKWLCSFMERYNQPSQVKPIELWGLTFPNMVGLAAGMDKNAQFWRAMAALGFGHVEIGTITQLRQPGNPKPRLMRYPQYGAIINRMGFNNEGAEVIASRLKAQDAADSKSIPLGINIGKSKVTPLDAAVDDYLSSFHQLVEYASYFTINVSSPNTPELRKLQGEKYLRDLLGTLVDANNKRAHKLGTKPVPILLKIAPDLSFAEIDSILGILFDLDLDGIVATNTTIARENAFQTVKDTGGLSGRPIHEKACKIVNYIYRSTEGKLPIVGVGGIFDPESAGRMVDAGASLVQVYTGFVYRGPFFAAEIAKALSSRHSCWH